MNNRAIKRRKHQARVISALRYLGRAIAMRVGPTKAVIRVKHLRAYYAAHHALDSDVPL